MTTCTPSKSLCVLGTGLRHGRASAAQFAAPERGRDRFRTSWVIWVGQPRPRYSLLRPQGQLRTDARRGRGRGERVPVDSNDARLFSDGWHCCRRGCICPRYVSLARLFQSRRRACARGPVRCLLVVRVFRRICTDPAGNVRRSTVWTDKRPTPYCAQAGTCICLPAWKHVRAPRGTLIFAHNSTAFGCPLPAGCSVWCPRHFHQRTRVLGLGACSE